MTGSIRSAANMAHGMWLAKNNANPIIIDGRSIRLVDGYPDAASLPLLMPEMDGFAVSVAGSTITFAPAGSPAGARCSVTYTQPAAPDSTYTLSSVVTAC
jgi:MSHA pilin protein MshA